MRRQSLTQVGSARRTSLNAEQLGERVLPAGVLAVGSDAGAAATVRTFIDTDDNGSYETLAGEFSPYGGSTGGVRVATGDFDGDGNDELVTGTGRYGIVKVWELNANGSVGQLIDTIHPFGAQTPGGVFLAAGDLNGDGKDELVVSRASGGNGVRIYSDVSGNGLLSDNQTDSFVPFPGAAPTGNRVAVGDTNGDGRAELIIGAGPGRGATVRIYSDTDLDRAVSDGAPIETFRAFGPGYTGGVFVAAGSLDGVGGSGAEVIVSRASGASTVRVYSDSNGNGRVGDNLVQTFQAGGAGGARVAVGDANGDGQAEVITATGNQVSIKEAGADGVNSAGDSFNPFPAGYSRNVFIACGEVDGGSTDPDPGTGPLLPLPIPLPLLDGPLTLLDGILGGNTVTLNVGEEAGTIADLNVDLSMFCSLLGNSTVTLTHAPTGLSATLFEGSGLLGGLLGSTDGLDITLDDEAGLGILEGVPVDGLLSGLFNCSGGSDALSIFDGIDATGDWILTFGNNSLLDIVPTILNGCTLDFLCYDN